MASRFRVTCVLMILMLCVATSQAQDKGDWFPYVGLRLDSNMTVVEAYPNSPAQKGGMVPGDVVVSIDGLQTEGTPHDKMVAKLRGSLGTTVVIVYRRGAAQSTVTSTRAPLPARLTCRLSTGQTISIEQLITVAGQTAETDKCYTYIVEGLSFLPRSVKQCFVDGGITIALTDEAGGAHFEPGQNRVVMYERPADRPDAEVDARMPITTLHELGHAYDKLLGYFSRTPEFMAAYAAEAPQVPTADRDILAHFLLPTPRGQSECFASLFACKYFQGMDRRLTTLKADFPNTFRLVQDI